MFSTMFEFLAMVWLLIGDIVAFFALVGAACTLLIATFDAWYGRSALRAFRKTADWSIGALCLGIVMFASVLYTDPADAPATFFFSTSLFNVGIMLTASVALLVSSILVCRLIRR